MSVNASNINKMQRQLDALADFNQKTLPGVVIAGTCKADKIKADFGWRVSLYTYKEISYHTINVNIYRAGIFVAY